MYKASLCVDVRFPCLFVSGVLVHSRRRWSAYAIVMCMVHHGINTLHVATVYVPSGTFASDFNEQFSELIGVLSYGHMGGMRLRTNFATESRVVTWSCGDRSVSKETYCVAYNLPGVWRITF